MNADISDLNDLSYSIIGAGQRVSNTLGVGFAERTYERALCVELGRRNVRVDRQPCYKVFYEEELVGEYVPDLVVADRIIVEIKALESVGRIERAQCINYLRATGLPLCLLVNFGRPRLEYFRYALTR